MAVGQVTVGENLTPMDGLMAKQIGRSLHLLLQLMARFGKTVYSDSRQKVFVKEGAPVADTAEDSPGSDLCLVWDSTNSDLYLIYGWTAEDSFDVQEIVG